MKITEVKLPDRDSRLLYDTGATIQHHGNPGAICAVPLVTNIHSDSKPYYNHGACMPQNAPPTGVYIVSSLGCIHPRHPILPDAVYQVGSDHATTPRFIPCRRLSSRQAPQ